MHTRPLPSKNPISLQAIVAASREQVSCDLVDEVVILSLRNGAYFGLNPVAAKIWELLKEPRMVAEIRDALLDEYAVEPERCTEELLTVLGQLREWELIEVRDGEPE